MKRAALVLALLVGCDAADGPDAIADRSDGTVDAILNDSDAILNDSDAILNDSDAILNDSNAIADATVDAELPPWFTAVTFNTGSGPEADHDGLPDDGYGQAEADLTDAWYGNGLAWRPFVEQTRDWFGAAGADLVAFQEIFHPGACAEIPPDARVGFVCEDWQPGAPTVAQRVLGADDDPGWQVACHPNRADKCLAVHRRLGRIAGCDGPLCLAGLEGHPVAGCGSGVRAARAVVELSDGGRLVVVSVHGTSGFSAEDVACRRAQVEQIFVGRTVDGIEQPALARSADPTTPVLILGDFNTDPGRVAAVDDSAARWLDFVGPEQPFRFISPVGPDAPRGYADAFDIDHLVGRGLIGACRIAGLDGSPPVTEARFFDHRPVLCGLRAPSAP